MAADDTIKISILHSLSGTMAISETTPKDVMLMLIDEQNKKGGVLGKKLEAVVVDPASNWPLFAEKAKELVEKDKVSAVFGCWTSVSRKWVKAVEKAQSFEADKVIPALIGVSVPNLTGGYSTMMPNHHITKPVYIG
jgi:ABC-type branched-subunit amino acid transport system substrate-binding protein